MALGWMYGGLITTSTWKNSTMRHNEGKQHHSTIKNIKYKWEIQQSYQTGKLCKFSKRKNTFDLFNSLKYWFWEIEKHLVTSLQHSSLSLLISIHTFRNLSMNNIIDWDSSLYLRCYPIHTNPYMKFFIIKFKHVFNCYIKTTAK